MRKEITDAAKSLDAHLPHVYVSFQPQVFYIICDLADKMEISRAEFIRRAVYEELKRRRVRGGLPPEI